MGKVKLGLVLAVVVLLLYQGHLYAQTPDLVAAEYFIDVDPGHGSGTAISISPDISVTVAVAIPTSGLSPGFHTLHVRARNEEGRWGMTEPRVFYVYEDPAAIEAVEYFVDEDPGHGQRKRFTVSAGDSVAVTEQIGTEGLERGFHTLHVRARNKNSRWGMTEPRVFYIFLPTDVTVSPLVSLEYFYDADPGFGAGVEIPISEADSVNISVGLPTTGLPLDNHTITVRAQNAAGSWSLGESRSFSMEGGPNDPPVVAHPIPDQELGTGDPPFVFDLTAPDSVFTDPNGDVLLYQVSSSDPSVATASISGSILTVVALSGGSATITVSADDGNGGTAQTTFVLDTREHIAFPGDFNGDGQVSLDDFSLFVRYYGLSEGDDDFDSLYDLDGDGQIGLSDCSIFARNYGKSTPSAKAVSSTAGRNTEAHLSADMATDVSSEGERRVRLYIGLQGAEALNGYAFKITYNPKKLLFLEAVRSRDNLFKNDRSELPLLVVVPQPGAVLIADATPEDEGISGGGSLVEVPFIAEGNLRDIQLRITEVDLLDAEGRLNTLCSTEVRLLPQRVALYQNYPNPFNPDTQIAFDLPSPKRVRLSVYALSGQKVRELVVGVKEAGYHSVIWDGSGCATGVYVYRLEAGDFVETRRMVLLK